ncbi:hypothetical protein TIFTF001_041566 [Ficus carica]|uniref:DUF7054 domain-containing protein n=1 Tax=Ficus carica TaxID=3494 RepID=A0AA87ZA73_FICCA|nr:hypothetical protein TIFTF001_041564 [Ficus carica]GMN31277.1 hypothetical protein TIFTF001_041566 [Ficus carica]
MSKHKMKKNGSAADHNGPKNRFLITVNVLGSAGPMRFVVNEDDLVAAVIDTALKSYSREGRLPVLGTHASDFLLYCANVGSDDRESRGEKLHAVQEAEAAADDRQEAIRSDCSEGNQLLEIMAQQPFSL